MGNYIAALQQRIVAMQLRNLLAAIRSCWLPFSIV